MVVTCTGGEAGSILNPAMDRPEVLANMAAIRRDEMARAAEILGVRHRWLGFVDSGLPEGDPQPPLPDGCFALVDLEEATRAAGRADARVPPARGRHLRRERRLPAPGPHPCHEVSVAAFDAAGDPDRFPDAGEPWQPLKLYYSHGFSKARLHRRPRGAAGPRPGVAVRRVAEELGRRPAATRAAGSPPGSSARTGSSVRDAALKAHATQIDPNSRWFAVPREIQREVWPYRGLRAGALAGRHAGAGGRPVRRHPRARGGNRLASDRRVASASHGKAVRDGRCWSIWRARGGASRRWSRSEEARRPAGRGVRQGLAGRAGRDPAARAWRRCS